MTWPVPPAVPILPMMARIRSLAVTPSGRSPSTRDAHVLGRLLDQRLGRQHMLDLGRADAEGQRAEGAMGRGVAVAADDGHAGLGQALLRADDVHDALADIVHGEIGNAELGAVLLQRLDLDARFLLDDALGAVGGRHVVVGHRERCVRPAHLAAGHAQALEGLRAGHLMHEVPVDIDQAGAVVLAMTRWLSQILSNRVRGAACHARSRHRASTPWLRRPIAWLPGFGRAATTLPSSSRRCAPTCRAGRAGNRAWRGGHRRGAPARSRQMRGL